MEKCPWAIGSARALTSPNAEITGGGWGMEYMRVCVCVCVCVSVCSGQCRSLSSDKQVLCHRANYHRPWTSQIPLDSAGGKGSSGVWRLSGYNPEAACHPVRQTFPSQARHPRRNQAHCPLHMCPWEYLSYMRVCLGTQSLLKFWLQPQSSLMCRLQCQSLH